MWLPSGPRTEKGTGVAEKKSQEWSDRKLVIVWCVIIVVLTFFFGVVPLWNFLSVRVGVHTTTVTVVGKSSSSAGRTSSRGTGVDFLLPSGKERETYMTTPFTPDKGNKIKVFYDHKQHEWLSAGRYGWSNLVAAVIVIPLGLVAFWWAAGGWKVLKRRRERS